MGQKKSERLKNILAKAFCTPQSIGRWFATNCGAVPQHGVGSPWLFHLQELRYTQDYLKPGRTDNTYTWSGDTWSFSSISRAGGSTPATQNTLSRDPALSCCELHDWASLILLGSRSAFNGEGEAPGAVREAKATSLFCVTPLFSSGYYINFWGSCLQLRGRSCHHPRDPPHDSQAASPALNKSLYFPLWQPSQAREVNHSSSREKAEIKFTGVFLRLFTFGAETRTFQPCPTAWDRGEGKGRGRLGLQRLHLQLLTCLITNTLK